MRAPDQRLSGIGIATPASSEDARVVPRRILLLRSGRHLRVAMDALAMRFPGCHIGVVGTPGSGPALQQAGIDEGDAFLYGASRFQPAAFFFSRTARAARRWDYDQIAILWNDPDGHEQGNVDRTALAMSPGGYVAVTPDGTLVERALWPQLRTEGMRVVASLAIGALLGIFLYGPALAMKIVRTILAWRPMKGRPAIVDVGSREAKSHPHGADGLHGRGTGHVGSPDPARTEAHHGPPEPSPGVVLPFKRPEARR